VRAFGTAGWSTMAPQTPGMWFQFELPEPTTLTELRFLSAAGGGPPSGAPRPVPYARGYEVQLSMDGTTWSAPVAEGRGSGASTTITFAPTRTRFVRITQTATTENAPPWAIQQLQLYEIRAAR